MSNNGGIGAQEAGLSLRSGFLASAERWPDSPAVLVRGEAVTYAQAAAVSRQWAGALIDACDGPPRRVGVLASRSATSYLGTLASLLAGATYVPLNPASPPSRTRAMLDQADLDAVIVDESSVNHLGALLRGVAHAPVVLTPGTRGPLLLNLPASRVIDDDELRAAPPLRELPAVDPDRAAYLVFTSASTGVPIGVPITHRNICSFLATNRDRYGLTPRDRVAQTFDHTFDLWAFSVFMAWQSGACVCAMQPLELMSPFSFLHDNGITVWFSLPSVARMLGRRGALTPGRMPTLRWSLFGGDNMSAASAQEWQAAAPNSTLESLYGPTELTIACASYRWDPARSPGECVGGFVPIGEFYGGLSHTVVDNSLRQVSPGEIGELCVAGPQTCPGYWRNSHQTRARTYRGDDGCTVYYRTGDRVRREGDHYIHLGRNDAQVKIGGHRVELGEIEAAAREAGCAEAVALEGPNDREPQYIDIVVCGTALTPNVLLRRFYRRLPVYMLPRSIEVVRQMPRDGDGQIDRGALRALLSGIQGGGAAVASRA